MNENNRTQLTGFLISDKQKYSGLLFALFDKLSLQFEFHLKIQKASIQLIHQHPFAVIGFRKSKDYLFVEFYHHSVINGLAIVKTKIAENSKIIHTIHLTPNAIINSNIINWIKDSYHLIITSNQTTYEIK